jgi:hypothetical protein
MAHPLILGFFDQRAPAAAAARAVHALGVEPTDLSIVSRDHQDEGWIAEQVGGTPGVEIADSRSAARLGELSGLILAAIAVGLPGGGSLVAAGPLAAGLGEAAGHVAGSLASVLEAAGLPEEEAAHWQSRIEAGTVLVGVHVRRVDDDASVETVLREHGAERILRASWSDE